MSSHHPSVIVVAMILFGSILSAQDTKPTSAPATKPAVSSTLR